jgi:hypothetical protein
MGYEWFVVKKQLKNSCVLDIMCNDQIHKQEF